MNQKLFHLSKRKELPWYGAWGIRLAAIAIALVVCGFVTTAMTGENPVAIYETMWAGAFGTNRRLWNTLQYLALLLCVSLAVTPWWLAACGVLFPPSSRPSGTPMRRCSP